MNKTFALKLIGGLGDVSKMPGASYGLPTRACITGSKLAKIEGTVCSKCYANKGFYATFKNMIIPAQERRLASITHPDWVEAMVVALKHEAWFRWFDSGDLQSVDHLDRIVQIALATPWCKHWLATREVQFVKEWSKGGYRFPENLCIRLSATYPDKPVRLGTFPFHVNVCISNVHNKKPPQGFECPAPKQHGRCDQCRACWDSSIHAVSYKEH